MDGAVKEHHHTRRDPPIVYPRPRGRSSTVTNAEALILNTGPLDADVKRAPSSKSNTLPRSKARNSTATGKGDTRHNRTPSQNLGKEDLEALSPKTYADHKGAASSKPAKARNITATGKGDTSAPLHNETPSQNPGKQDLKAPSQKICADDKGAASGKPNAKATVTGKGDALHNGAPSPNADLKAPSQKTCADYKGAASEKSSATTRLRSKSTGPLKSKEAPSQEPSKEALSQSTKYSGPLRDNEAPSRNPALSQNTATLSDQEPPSQKPSATGEDVRAFSQSCGSFKDKGAPSQKPRGEYATAPSQNTGLLIRDDHGAPSHKPSTLSRTRSNAFSFTGSQNSSEVTEVPSQNTDRLTKNDQEKTSLKPSATGIENATTPLQITGTCNRADNQEPPSQNPSTTKTEDATAHSVPSQNTGTGNHFRQENTGARSQSSCPLSDKGATSLIQVQNGAQNAISNEYVTAGSQNTGTDNTGAPSNATSSQETLQSGAQDTNYSCLLNNGASSKNYSATSEEHTRARSQSVGFLKYEAPSKKTSSHPQVQSGAQEPSAIMQSTRREGPFTANVQYYQSYRPFTRGESTSQETSFCSGVQNSSATSKEATGTPGPLLCSGINDNKGTTPSAISKEDSKGLSQNTGPLEGDGNVPLNHPETRVIPFKHHGGDPAQLTPTNHPEMQVNEIPDRISKLTPLYHPEKAILDQGGNSAQLAAIPDEGHSSAQSPNNLKVSPEEIEGQSKKAMDNMAMLEQGINDSKKSMEVEDPQIQQLREECHVNQLRIRAQEITITAMDGEIEALDSRVKAKDNEIKVGQCAMEVMDNNIKVKEYEIAAMNSDKKVKEDEIISKENKVSVRDSIIIAKEGEIKLKDRKIAMKEDEIKTKIKLKDSIIKMREDKIKAKEEEIMLRDSIIKAKEDEIKGKDREIESMDSKIKTKDHEMEAMHDEIEGMLKARDNEIMHYKWTGNQSWNIPRAQMKSIAKREIGHGAWGVVYSGTFQGQRVAIKHTHRAVLHPKTIEMLKREVMIMAEIQHPNLVRFIAAVFDDAVDRGIDTPIIVSELMDMNLREAYKKVDLSSHLVSILCDVAYALHYLHQYRHPIIHRDISAPNVLLRTLQNGAYQAKVSDFGSANCVKQACTAGAGAIIYSAPEMFPSTDMFQAVTPKPQTTKVDVYSYGILMLEVIVKEMPDPKTCRTFLQEVQRQSVQMHDLIVHCTKPLPSDRPTMADILNKLHQFLQARAATP